mmetsp:Transcript_36664/g.65992  ORF Transcript_36664/g.65992 Transcript_36664/m.65992 type:complete len:379 (+) Transcript_36664:144-1280(+)|eukprot:CAMPEP_0201879496 /NCGR_PEP_ID=MMETSP0902-20130614/10358_1 /ASSEMBLY_ACC=CAM_ASM_000551 /TAXON_ID=420261 /ORGANISM="Thalassiosira antarctica, Strain CCMP982" /LENGTH=378 /DNA_ID=CAMNT_0048407327 /DNA_START=56 /DNA_END=1192 /DNA_ORIENTATION=+
MVLFALGRHSSGRSLYHYLIICRNATTSTTDGQHHLGRGQVITGSLSGAKHVSKLVPPSSTISIGGINQNHGKAAKKEARLLVSGPDATGIVASFSQLLFGHGCGIVDCTSESSEEDNYSNENGSRGTQVVRQHQERVFFQRIVFDYSNINVERSVVGEEIESICQKYGMEGQLSWGDKRRKMAIFVSKYDHCLWELLLRHRAGELLCDIPLIISNHEDLRPVAETFNIPYQVFPITKETKSNQEQKQMQLLKEQNIDLVVLARYMQLLTPTFCNSFHNRIINIHHSFLPAFMGGMPYHRAHERGVKLIGATAHYATMDLDQGPIIEQDIMRVSHRDDVKDLIRKGRTLEKNVLVSAAKAHLENRIIVHKNKCIMFAE